MNKLNLIIFILILCGTGVLSAQDIDYKAFPEWSWGKEDSTEYMLYTPKNMKPGEVYPIALFMHGCCGKDYTASPRNAVDPPARMWHNFGANTQEIPTYIISAATSRGWSQHFKNLKKVIDNLVEKGQGDPARIYVTGFSMGGRGTWQFIQEYPGYFAAALPMGMDFQGDPELVKNIPVWTNQGETDWYCRGLSENVAIIRKVNGYPFDGTVTWETGVNPRYSNFKGIGHGVQWMAASTQDLTGWAYSKINDGNTHPIVFFESPRFKEKYVTGEKVQVRINAKDPDGNIEKVEFFVAGKLFKTFTKEPFETEFVIQNGDTQLSTIVYDNGGKTEYARTVVQVDINPSLDMGELPYARVGALYEKQLQANGNGTIKYEVNYGENLLPAGFSLTENGLLKGIPIKEGRFPVSLIISDEDNDRIEVELELEVRRKRTGEVVIYQTMNTFNCPSVITKARLWEIPHFNADNEINFSNLNGFDELTLIQTDSRDAEVAGEEYLSFVVNDEVQVYVAYEKFDNLFTSTIPEWLKSWEKEDKEIVAQYRYFDVYKKSFPRGKIILPGGDVIKNKVKANYFVMVQGSGEMDYAPEISTTSLPSAALNQPYQQQLDRLYGIGEVKWKLISGKLPEGLELCECGVLSGTPGKKGKFKFTMEVTDLNGNSSRANLSFKVR
ncbi:MAG: putative Ig domain-containing protein [Mariniphaga sp.]